MPRVANCASTWANQTCGSAGQKGGILRLTAATVGAAETDGVPLVAGVVEASAGGSPGLDIVVVTNVVAVVLQVARSQRLVEKYYYRSG